VARKRAGYTLLEISLVIALMVMLLALAVPSMDGLYGEVKVKGAADKFEAAMLTARSHAIDEGVPYGVAIVPGTGHFRIATAASFKAGGAGDSNPAMAGGSGSFAEQGELPDGIVFTIDNELAPVDNGDTSSPTLASHASTQPVDPSQWKRQATFLPDGTALEDSLNVTIRKSGCRPLELQLRGLTGSVTVTRPDAGNGHP
jgi:type II secretory pathway pseudopilin PulG